MWTVLIIDDDAEFSDMTRIVLEAHGYAVRAAATAAEGLAAVDQAEPDLVILDVMMESLAAGFTAAQQLRAGQHKAVPILMVTSVSEKTGLPFDPDTDKDYMPVDGYLEKPVKPKDLIAAVERALARK